MIITFSPFNKTSTTIHYEIFVHYKRDLLTYSIPSKSHSHLAPGCWFASLALYHMTCLSMYPSPHLAILSLLNIYSSIFSQDGSLRWEIRNVSGLRERLYHFTLPSREEVNRYKTLVRSTKPCRLVGQLKAWAIRYKSTTQYWETEHQQKFSENFVLSLQK